MSSLSEDEFIKLKEKYIPSNKTFNEKENALSIVVQLNKSEFHQVYLDRDKILSLDKNEQQLCCDFLLIEYIDSDPLWLFIELKGQDVTHAQKQIANTYNYFKQHIKSKRLYAAIVYKSDDRKKKNIKKNIISKTSLEKYGIKEIKNKTRLHLEYKNNVLLIK